MQWQDLSEAQQLQYGDALAHEALTHFALENPNITRLAYTHNLVYRVDTDEQTYTLRLSLNITNPEWFVSEVMFLHYLKKYTSFGVPNPVFAKDDKHFIKLMPDKLSHPIYVTLFEFVEGEPLTADAITPDSMQRIAHALALFHQNSDKIKVPTDFDRPILDYEGLFGESGIYHSEEATRIFTDAQNTIIAETLTHIQKAFTHLDAIPKSSGLIHADLLSKNIIVNRDVVTFLDWEYLSYSYYLYDLTPLLWQLKTQPNYHELESAYWSAYSELQPVADLYPYLETLICARQVASLRWLAQNLHNPSVKDVAPQLINQRISELQGFLDTGKLVRNSQTL